LASGGNITDHHIKLDAEINLEDLNLVGFIPEEQYLNSIKIEDGTEFVFTAIEHIDGSISLFGYADGTLLWTSTVAICGEESEIMLVADGDRYTIIEHQYGSITTNTYNGFHLTWRYIGNRHVLENISNDLFFISYEYDYRGNRILKNVNGEITKFFYCEHNFLEREISGDNEIIYLYENFRDDETDRLLVGVIINGETFTYLFDESALIIGLIAANGDVVVKYQYNDLLLTSVQVLLDGEFVCAELVPGKTALLNNMVGLGQHLDKKTGWYYRSGEFFNPRSNEFLPRPFIMHELSVNILSRNTSDAAIRTQVATLVNWRLNDTNFGRTMTHSSGWFSNLTEAEIMARLINGEANNEIAQARGVGWVVVNRMQHSNRAEFSGPTARGVMSRSGAFAALTGNSTDTRLAREPDRNAARWINSVEIASFAIFLQSEGYLKRFNTFNPRPSGYVNQLFFVARGWWDANSRNVTNLTGGTGEYRMDGTWHRVRDINNLGSAANANPRGNVFFNLQ